MQTAFYVSHAGQTYGPWTVSEITRRIAQMELIATDYIYDEAKNGWIPLLDCEAIVGALRSQKPSAPPTAPTPTVQKEAMAPTTPTPDKPIVPTPEDDLEDASSGAAEWFIQKDTHRYGPFTYLGMIKALQEKTVFDYDMIWKEGMAEWTRLAEHPMFSPDSIRAALSNGGQKTAKFFSERKFDRFPLKSEVIVHDNKAVWLGQTYQGSEGGSGMTIRNALLMPGQVLFLHFTQYEGIPAFNALCEIVNKRYVANVRDPRSAVPYGVKFVKVDKKVREAMKDYYASKAS